MHDSAPTDARPPAEKGGSPGAMRELSIVHIHAAIDHGVGPVKTALDGSEAPAAKDVDVQQQRIKDEQK